MSATFDELFSSVTAAVKASLAKEPKEFHTIKTVVAVNADGSVQVRLNTSSSTTTRCVVAEHITPKVGDMLMVVKTTNGRCYAIGKF